MLTTILFVTAFVAVSFFYCRMAHQKTVAIGKKFLDDHPDAAKVYLTCKISLVTEIINVLFVDGEAPVPFIEAGKLPVVIAGLPGCKNGIYLQPGTRTLDVQYTRNRPGVFYKNVRTTTGLVKKEIVVEAGKNYLLAFNREEEVFTLTEVPGDSKPVQDPSTPAQV
jgi:hypothetical protein